MKVIRFIAAFAAGAYFCALATLYVAQRRLVFANDPRQTTPVDAGFPEASVTRISTADDESLVAWYAKPAPDKMLALYFHGNGGSLAQRGDVLRRIAADGTGVLAIDYRGYGGSTGSPGEEGLGLDADAAWDKARQLGYAPNEIVAIGASLGTGVAVGLAARHDVAGVVLDSPYSSTLDVAADRYWMFPVAWLMRDPFHSDRIIQNVRAPLLFMHGALDRTIPIRFGERLYSLATAPKEFLRVEDAGHLVLNRPEGIARTRDFIGRLGLLAGR